jgi:hypothetical protein
VHPCTDQEKKTEEDMVKRSGAGQRRAAVMAAAVAGFGMLTAMAGGAAAADKGRESDSYGTTAVNCSVLQDWSYYRKCGDTGSEHEPRAEAQRTRDPDPETPTDNEPVGAATAPAD